MSAPDRPTVLAFRPGENGFHFANSWLRGAPVRLGRWTVFRVRGGLCGGMCHAARTLWAAGERPPTDTCAPEDPGELSDRLWHAQLRSLGLPFGPLRFLWLQLPARGDAARRRVTLDKTLPAVRRSISAGRPLTLGLVRTVSWSPGQLSRNHQVLAYGYEELPDRVEIHIYDPNLPDDERVRLSVASDGRATHTDGHLVAAIFPTGR